MKTAEFKKIARLLKEVYQEIEKEALKEGINILSPEYDQLIAKARERVLENAGFTLQQYREAKAKVAGFSQADYVDSIEQSVSKFKELEDRHIPTKEEIEAIAEQVAKKYIVPPKITNQIVKEYTIEKPKIVETTRIINTKEKYNAKPLEEKIDKVSKKLDAIKIPDLSEDTLKEKITNYFSENFEKNINTLGMPDFRKLAMGLQAQIDALGTGGSGGGTWGSITGTLSNQTDLQSALDAKQATLVSGTNIKTINGTSILASGDLTLLTSLSGAVLTDQTVGQTIGTTGARLTKLWATDITVTNAIDGSITGNAGTVTNGVYTTGAGTVFEVPLTFGDGLTRTANDIDVDTTQNITTLSNLTANGVVTTSGGVGTLGVSTFPADTTKFLDGFGNWNVPPGTGANTALSNLASVAINAALVLGTSDAFALGSATKMWSDLFLADGAVINFNAGNTTLTHSAGLLTSNVDIVVPTEVYGAGWNGSNEVPTKDAIYDKIETLSGLAWGASIAGTTADGVTLTLSNSSNDGASALKLIAGNTQANQATLANLQIGTSANIQGVMIQGTGSTTVGAVGTGKNHLSLWANVDTSNVNVLSIANGTAYTQTLRILANGAIIDDAGTNTLPSGYALNYDVGNIGASNRAILRAVFGNTQTNAGLAGVKFDAGTSGKVSGGYVFGTFSTDYDYTTGGAGWTAHGSTASQNTAAFLAGNGASFIRRWSVSTAGQTIQDLAIATVSANTVTLPNSVTTAKAGYEVTLGNTQANSPYGFLANVGTSAKVTGVMIKGTFGTATTGLTSAFTAWGNVDAQATRAFTTGNGTTYTEKAFINTDGTIHTLSTIELGHASDTTISRVSAGVIAIEGNTIATVKTVATNLPFPVIPYENTSGTSGLYDNTVMNVFMFSITQQITFTKVSLYVGVGATGTFKLGIFSEDGQTRYATATSASVTADALNTVTVSSTTLPPGNYWLGLLSVDVSGIDLIAYTCNSNFSVLSGEPLLAGVYTVTADTIPTTITLASISDDPSTTSIFRLD